MLCHAHPGFRLAHCGRHLGDFEVAEYAHEDHIALLGAEVPGDELRRFYGRHPVERDHLGVVRGGPFRQVVDPHRRTVSAVLAPEVVDHSTARKREEPCTEGPLVAREVDDLRCRCDPHIGGQILPFARNSGGQVPADLRVERAIERGQRRGRAGLRLREHLIEIRAEHHRTDSCVAGDSGGVMDTSSRAGRADRGRSSTCRPSGFRNEAHSPRWPEVARGARRHPASYP